MHVPIGAFYNSTRRLCDAATTAIFSLALPTFLSRTCACQHLGNYSVLLHS